MPIISTMTLKTDFRMNEFFSNELEATRQLNCVKKREKERKERKIKKKGGGPNSYSFGLENGSEFFFFSSVASSDCFEVNWALQFLCGGKKSKYGRRKKGKSERVCGISRWMPHRHHGGMKWLGLQHQLQRNKPKVQISSVVWLTSASSKSCNRRETCQ